MANKIQAEREFDMFPADVRPGMDDEDEFDFDSGDSDDDFMDDFNNPIVTNNNIDIGNQPIGNTKSTEDVIFDTIKEGLVKSKDFIKEVIIASKKYGIIEKKKMGRAVIFVGGLATSVGILLKILGLKVGGSYIVGGLLSLGVGIAEYMYAIDYISTHDIAEIESKGNEDELFDMGEDEEIAISLSNNKEDSSFMDEVIDDLEDEDMQDELYGEGEDEEWAEFVEEEKQPQLKKIQMDKLDELGVGVTRERLFDLFLGILPKIEPDFAKEVEYDEDSDEIVKWEENVIEAADLQKKETDTENLHVQGVSETAYAIIVKLNRPTWLKNIKAFCDELKNLIAYDETTYQIDNTITVTATARGKTIHVVISKVATLSVSLADAYRTKSCREFMLNKKNYLPVAYGVDGFGHVLCTDFKNLDSLLVAGQPRTGKTWTLKMILGQMLMFQSPKDLHIYFCDPKGEMSDWYTVRTPHVKRFASTVDEIVSLFDYVVNDFAKQRKELMGAAGCQNIWDYNERYPQNKQPLVYIMMDEVISIMSSFGTDKDGKEAKKSFMGLIKKLVTELPMTGIRLFLTPHVVKNDIIDKTITDNIPCRISVLGDNEQIEKVTGEKNFTRKLTEKGDMAVKISRGSVLYAHSLIIAQDNESLNNIYEQIGQLWAKLNPDTVENSLMNEENRKGISRGITSEDNTEEVKPKRKRNTTKNKSENATTKSEPKKSKPTNTTNMPNTTDKNNEEQEIMLDILDDDILDDDF